MKAKITILSLAIFLLASSAIAQNPSYYPKPNRSDLIPFGQRVSPHSPRILKNDYQVTNPYPIFDSATKQSKVHMPGRIINEYPSFPSTGIGGNVNSPINQKNSQGIFHLTKDINDRAESDPQNYSNDDYPEEFAVLHNVSYFYANDGIHGFEVWRSDATKNGTYLLKDINPGEAGLDDLPIQAANDKIYFPANDGTSGVEPWVSDGTEKGTHLLMDINYGSSGSYPSQFVAVNHTVFFVANNNQLWKTTGTFSHTAPRLDSSVNTGDSSVNAGGASIVKNLYDASQIYESTSANGLLFFIANTYAYGWQLWRSDGTDAGTYIVKQIGYYLNDYSAPMQLTEYHNKLFFSVDDGTGRRLWTSDGTYDGTNYASANTDVFMQSDYLNVRVRNPFRIIKNVLYIAGYTYADGSGLYKYDDSKNAGVVLVKGITPYSDSAVAFITPVDFAVVNNRLYFKVISSIGGYHDELWKSDGTSSSTQFVKIFVPGETTFDHNNGNGLLYFNKIDTVYGNELWESDGTGQGTKLVKDIWPGRYESSAPYYLTECNGKLLFNAADNVKGASLCVTDGTANGTVLLKDINTTSTSGSNAGGSAPNDMAMLKNGVIFNAFERGHGIEAYVSDGSSTGTFLLKDILEGEANSYPNGFISKNDMGYFRANNSNVASGFAGSTIYKTNGTSIGTQKIADVNNAYFYAYNVTDKGLAFYLIYNLSTSNNEIWRSDGTAGGTFMVASNVYYSGQVAVAGNNAFFVAGDYNTGYELWKSDGTVQGTKMVKDIYPGSGGSYPYSLVAFKNNIYFAANDGGSAYSFWRSDGTDKGTIKLKDITPAYADDLYSISLLFTASGNNLYFNAIDYNANPYIGGELYKTNGTPGGTQLVKDINQYSDSYPNNLTDVNGELYFTANDGINGNELWKSNGTAPGTKLVKDISLGSDGSNLSNLCSAGGKLFFLKDQYQSNQSFWSSDGTVANTNIVIDAGLNGLSSIHNLTGSGSKLFFGAYSYKYGTELYEGDIYSAAERLDVLPVATSIFDSTIAKFNAVIYPNPATSIATLRIDGNAKEVFVSIANMSGSVLWQSSFSNLNLIKLPIEKFSAGMYIVTVKNGIEGKTVKLVKQ